MHRALFFFTKLLLDGYFYFIQNCKCMWVRGRIQTPQKWFITYVLYLYNFCSKVSFSESLEFEWSFPFFLCPVRIFSAFEFGT